MKLIGGKTGMVSLKFRFDGDDADHDGMVSNKHGSSGDSAYVIAKQKAVVRRNTSLVMRFCKIR